VSSPQHTRIFYSSGADREAGAPKSDGFSVVEPAARTTLFPARSAAEPAKDSPEPGPNAGEPRPRFAAGGTQIMSRSHELTSVPSAPSALAQTRQFSVDQLLSRRAEFNREQELNRELERELGLLAPSSEPPQDTVEVQPSLDVSRPPAKPSKRWLRLSMLGLLLASGALLLFKPRAEPAASPRTTSSSAPAAGSELAASTPVLPPPAASVALKPHSTRQRLAADVIAEGRYAEALPLYRQLAASEPENSAYAEVVQILERRIAATTKPEPPRP